MVDFMSTAGHSRRKRHPSVTEYFSKFGTLFCIIFTVVYVLMKVYEHAAY